MGAGSSKGCKEQCQVNDVAPTSNMVKAISTASLPKTNDVVFELVRGRGVIGKSILEVGAGHGYLTQQLGLHIETQGGEPRQILQACDLFPEYFEYDGIECKKLNFMDELPFEPMSFDTIYAVEVIEHLENPALIREAYRILKPGGIFIYTTPNILNANSRFDYLFSGFFELFGLISYDSKDAGNVEGHIMPLNYYYLDYFMRKNGFARTEVYIDRIKRSAVFYSLFLYPLIRIEYCIQRWKYQRRMPNVYEKSAAAFQTMNSFRLLTSRTIIMVGHKEDEDIHT
jgi:SAM-dependent methyltransferase